MSEKIQFLEKHLEVPEHRRFVDVRPASTRFAEWLTTTKGLMISFVPALLTGIAAPVTMPIVSLWLMVVFLVYLKTKPLMPLRYSAAQTDPSNGKPGKGILYFGGVRSSLPAHKFREVWAGDDDMRKHSLIIGSTGSGKSETLKGIFFNALCWSSGFFIADGKADNKLPLDVAAMARSVGRDDSVLYLNFLLAGLTPQQVAKSRVRRTNGINPFSSADADTLIQMGSNLLPKVDGDAKNWQEKALNLWRALCRSLCYKRDKAGFQLSVGSFVDYMSLDKVGELYIEGYREFLETGEWSYGYADIKSYLESGGCPGYNIEKLLNKYGLGEAAQAAASLMPGAKKPATNQDNAVLEQHGYRSTQLMPALNLLDKTYGYIFRARYPEIDMIDVALNNRILVMLIPSLEKSAQEAENLGKLAIACLRVMMGRNLGAGIEGTRAELLDSKATEAPYPYVVALDELAYYFADGLAVIFAQARSLGMAMIAATQDLKKLTEGSREAEAGAMMANTMLKYFMRIDEAKQTWDLVRETVGKAQVAVRNNWEKTSLGWESGDNISIQEVDRVALKELQEQTEGQGILNTQGKTMRVASFYMGDDLKKYPVNNFRVLRYLQVEGPSHDQLMANSIPVSRTDDKLVRGQNLLEILTYRAEPYPVEMPSSPVIAAMAAVAKALPANTPPAERGIALYQAAKAALEAMDDGGLGGGADEDDVGFTGGLADASGSAVVLGAPMRPEWGGLDQPMDLSELAGAKNEFRVASRPAPTEPPVSGAMLRSAVVADPAEEAPVSMDDFDNLPVLRRRPASEVLRPAPAPVAPAPQPRAPEVVVAQTQKVDMAASLLAEGRTMKLPRREETAIDVASAALSRLGVGPDWIAGVFDEESLVARASPAGDVVALSDVVQQQLISSAEASGNSKEGAAEIVHALQMVVVAEVNAPESKESPVTAAEVEDFFRDML